MPGKHIAGLDHKIGWPYFLPIDYMMERIVRTKTRIQEPSPIALGQGADGDERLQYPDKPGNEFLHHRLPFSAAEAIIY
jgi:hypothetical protein